MPATPSVRAMLTNVRPARMRRVMGRGVSRRREWIELGEIFLEGGDAHRN